MYICSVLGLGDLIICNGLIRHLVNNNLDKSYTLTVKDVYAKQVEYMFRDLKSLKFHYVKNDNDTGDFIRKNKLVYGVDFLLIGLWGHVNFFPSYAHDFSGESIIIDYSKTEYTWDQWFYIKNAVDLKIRHTDFKIERDEARELLLFNKLNPERLPYAVIHNIGSDGVDRILSPVIDKSLKLIYIDNTHTDLIFDYIKILTEAEEIHCIDSCFKHLVDFFETKAEKTGRLFYYNKAQKRKGRPHSASKKWNLL